MKVGWVASKWRGCVEDLCKRTMGFCGIMGCSLPFSRISCISGLGA